MRPGLGDHRHPPAADRLERCLTRIPRLARRLVCRRGFRILGLLVALCGMAGCALSPERVARIDRLVDAKRGTDSSCPEQRAERCAQPSVLNHTWEAIDRGVHPGHQLAILDSGPDALAARVHLIRSAVDQIAMQSYIFYDDHSGQAVLDELIQAARRGIRVRVLVDALFSLPDPELLARLVLAHQNLEIRLYNPLLERAVINRATLAASVLCCFRKLNHRMHNKLLAIDGRHAIIGGRNVAERYFDLDTRTNFVDLELLITGPQVARMEAGFEDFWNHELTRPAAHMRDVARAFEAVAESGTRSQERDERVGQILSRAADPGWLEQLMAAHGFAVSRVEYFTDPPAKPWPPGLSRETDSTGRMHELILAAQSRVTIKTPYFVLSRRFHRVLEALDDSVTVEVATNSLASTDAYPVYAHSRRQRFEMVDGLGIHRFELKPFPVDREVFLPRYARLVEEKAAGITGSMRVDPALPTRPMPGPRVSLHGKALVIDGEIAVVTSHNFDPRSEFFNSENGLIVRDRAFAGALDERIARFRVPGNSWVVAARNFAAGGPGPLNRILARGSRRLVTLDLWPAHLTENYRLAEDAEPVPPDHPDFHKAYEPVGEMPEVVRRRRILVTGLISRMFGFLKPIM